ncbi:MAG: NUDIX domain-containing protein [Deltaproteobacteria bacterium]|nr:NUDIX domain-containing protein [Deltaproteobacteria bacterium]MBW2354633.1 NUDIX domain-containing protein [Deltaproteobacteria bacterium]
MGREYPEYPIVGVSAIIFKDKAVLLVRRGQEPGKGRWSLPGGVVELGEGHLEALERELREELSIKIEVGGLAGVFDKIFRDGKNRVRYHYVVVDYWGWLVQGEPAPASDVSEVKVVPLEELEEFETDRALKKIIRRAYHAWQQGTNNPDTNLLK